MLKEQHMRTLAKLIVLAVMLANIRTAEAYQDCTTHNMHCIILPDGKTIQCKDCGSAEWCQ